MVRVTVPSPVRVRIGRDSKLSGLVTVEPDCVRVMGSVPATL